jgi:flavin-dependent dehydrogenase
LRIGARLFVDASGVKGILRRQIPLLNTLCPAPAREDLCSAAQEVYAIDDFEGAKTFLENSRAEPGHIIAYVGVAGGFSLLRVHVEKDLRHVAFLTGTVSHPDLPSGKQLIYDFVRKHPWIGARSFGGSRSIPLRRPYSTLTAPGVALLGDAACQVYATHGSGIGIGLVAANLLAECVSHAHAQRLDIGAPKNLWPYAFEFHREWGFLLHSADFFRRFTQSLSKDDVRRLIASGLISKGIFLDALLQQTAKPRLHELPKQVMAGITNLDLVARLAPMAMRFPQIAWAARHFPKGHDDHQGLLNYEKTMAALVRAV